MAGFKSSLTLKPVPFTEDINQKGNHARKYMTDDQRFAARRPDVLVYETEVLENNMTLVTRFLLQEHSVGCKVGSISVEPR
jgi:predicted acyl esterase